MISFWLLLCTPRINCVCTLPRTWTAFLPVCTCATDGREEGKRELHVQPDRRYRFPSPVSVLDSWSRQKHSFVRWLKCILYWESKPKASKNYITGHPVICACLLADTIYHVQVLILSAGHNCTTQRGSKNVDGKPERNGHLRGTHIGMKWRIILKHILTG